MIFENFVGLPLAYSDGVLAHHNNDAFVLQLLQCIFELLTSDHLKWKKEERTLKKNQ